MIVCTFTVRTNGAVPGRRPCERDQDIKFSALEREKKTRSAGKYGRKVKHGLCFLFDLT